MLRNRFLGEGTAQAGEGYVGNAQVGGDVILRDALDEVRVVRDEVEIALRGVLLQEAPLPEFFPDQQPRGQGFFELLMV